MGEREGFECEYGEAINERKEEGIAEIAHEAHGAQGGTKVVGVFLTQIKSEHIGLKKGEEGE